MIDQTTGLMLLAGFNGVVAVGALWMRKRAEQRYNSCNKLRHGWRESALTWRQIYDDAADVIRDRNAAEAAERSRRVSKGNRTRYAKQRALVAAKTAELKGVGL